MILVTGGTGLVGSHLLYQLTLRGEKVRATKRPSSQLADVALAFSFYSPEAKNLLDLIEWVDVDLENPYDVNEVCAGITSIFHCAAQVSFRPKDAHNLRTINPRITANLVDAALNNNVGYFVHVSSVAAIGRNKTQSEIITENTEWKNSPDNSNYAISKFGAELEVWRGIEEGLKAGIVNPSIILGPGNWNHSSNAIFKRLSKPFPFYTTGSNGFVDVRDVVAALLSLFDKKISGQRFIVVGENLPYRTLFDKLAVAFGQPKPHRPASTFVMGLLWRFEYLRSILFGTDPLVTKETTHSGLSNWSYSNAKAKADLGISFHAIDQSIEDFVPFYMKHFLD